MQLKQISSSSPATAAAIVIGFQLVGLLNVVSGHTRLECPPSRSKETGAKFGPCDAPDDLSLPPYPLHPGLNTITWLESIGHPGAPARFALSLEGVDDGFESCVLLDHVPHDEQSSPNFGDPLTYNRQSITLFLPDVYCERCHIQLVTFMTDELHGVPVGDECAYKGAQAAGTVDGNMPGCKVVYHSCAPISIDGSIPRDEYQCSLEDFERELDWPFMEDKPHSSIYLYKGDTGIYDRDTAVLQSGGSPVEGCNNFFYCDPDEFYQMTHIVPEGAKYAAPHGSCAAITDMKVEPFVLGELPSVPKVESSSVEAGNTEMNDNNGSITESQGDEVTIVEPPENLFTEEIPTVISSNEEELLEVESMNTSASPSSRRRIFCVTVDDSLLLLIPSLLVLVFAF